MESIETIHAELRKDLASINRRGTKYRLVQEAERLIALRGINNLQIKDLAEAVDIRPPSVYKHFRNREAVIDQIAREFFAVLMDQLRLDTARPWDKELQYSLNKLCEMFADRPAWVRIFLYDFSVPGGLEFITAIIGPWQNQLQTGLLSGLRLRLQNWLTFWGERGEVKNIDADWLLNVILGTLALNLTWSDRPIQVAPLPRTELKRLQLLMHTTVKSIITPTAGD
ncbi:TetR/AcrR family transcriptional regulator [Parahaliea maris]|uniref:TetR/AcrR family transcriptional regulator n=1 Tax=Parahaliea maris TaxID=2716870 RepID=UPI00164F565C|nr:TetR/AcrR family transcriptional regulator [Parahaliea maris]